MDRRASLLALASLLLSLSIATVVSGCGGGTPAATDAARDDAGSDDAGATDAATDLDGAREDAAVAADASVDDDAAASIDGACARPDAAMGSSEVMCTASPVVFPIFDRSCCAASDCVVVRHQIDCCGSFTQTGISASVEGGFQTAETTCEAQYPRCRCLARPDVANDDTMAITPMDVASVRCVDHVCQTTFAL